MSDIKNKFVVIALTQNEARIWATGLEKGTHPDKVFAPSDKGSPHHVKQGQHHGGHVGDPAEKGFFDVIAGHVSEASEILLIGHGEGKANAMVRFVQYMERHNPAVAKKVVGAIDSDLNAMTENQILSTCRDWFDRLHRRGLG